MNFRSKWVGFLILWLQACGAASGQVVINEIHYDPDVKTELVEFVELYNAGSTAVEVSGWSLRDAVEYVIPGGTQIGAGGYLVISENPTALQAKFRVGSLGPFIGKLSTEGDKVTLRDATGAVVDSVEYQLGFPWPTVGEPPGFSIELINPALDNSLGGSWRASVDGGGLGPKTDLVPAQSTWKWFKGLSEPSSPANAWRQVGFDDSSWGAGPGPIGYDPAVSFGTFFSDMNSNYSTFYLRRTFVVQDPASVGSLALEAMYDDGFKLWINGTNVLIRDMSTNEVAHDGTSTGASARESNDYESFVINNPASFLKPGTNLVAVQVANISLSRSSDCFFDARLYATAGGAGVGPTPGARNAAWASNAPPQVRQVEHHPKQPAPGQAVTVTAKVTDPDGVGTVTLEYQEVDPGGYIELTDAAYTNKWTSVAMRDDGQGGDELAADSVYTVVLPGGLQTHRRLVRYRLKMADAGGRSLTVPYADDPCPNFAYFVHAGVPAWSGAVRPGDPTLGQVVTVSSNEMNRLPVIQLLSKKASVENATWFSKYSGDAYPWGGTLVYDGEVLDHIHYRARGGGWRYAMVKNMWKFDLNRGHDLQARDDWGRKFRARWTKLNLGACIQQGDYWHRGEQGMFESVGLKLFNMAGVPAPKTAYAQLRIVDEATEVTPGNQYEGDFWGIYLMVEQENGRFLDEHGLPDGNLYKMESGTGELNNLGPLGPTDKSDLNTFLNTYNNTTPTDAWWRMNLNLEAYYGYQAIVQGIHHYDIADGKNYFYYRNPTNGLWTVIPWDLDLTWADNMYRSGQTGGDEPFKSRVLSNFAFPGSRPALSTEFRNFARSLRDLLFNSDEGFRLIDEYAGRLRGPTGVPGILDADRSQWDYNPKMVNAAYSSALSKAQQGYFYKWSQEPAVSKDFDGCVQLMKNYINYRGGLLDGWAADANTPSRPTLTYAGPTNYPVNRLRFQSSSMSGIATNRWRIGEVTVPTGPSWQYGEPWVYEVDAVWDTGDGPARLETVSVPAGVLRPGHVYRARVRTMDSVGRSSRWSLPVQFVAGAPDNAAALLDHLRLTELMASPAGGAADEFIELMNTGTNMTLDLGGAVFTSGVSYTFELGVSLPPGECLLVVGTPDLAAFRSRNNVPAGVQVVGPWTGSLADGGEKVTLKVAPGGEAVLDFAYGAGRGWPVETRDAGHSLVVRPAAMAGQSTGALDWPGNWRASARIGGSPGVEDPPAPAALVVINEVAAHTDYTDPARPEYDSNDWIELANVAVTTQSLSGYWLSDDAANLRKWALPATNLEGGARVVFDEVSGFHTPITSGFGLDKAGEQVLLSWLPGDGTDRVVDSVRFKGQENERSIGRYPEGATSPFRYPLLRTAGETNSAPVQGLVISEVHYCPPDPTGTNDNTRDEFVELYNPLASAVALWDTNGSWRLGGGVGFTFSTNAVLGAGQALLVVNFDPADSATLAAFRAAHGITNMALAIAGPYSGKLGNRSDRVALEKPQYPDFPDDLDYSWVIVDEVIYGNQDPWPAAALAGGASLQRLRVGDDGNDPKNWIAAVPTPGTFVGHGSDRDGDGMPDDWESANGLNPDNPADADKDADKDGMTNLQEYHAGTNPTSAASRLELVASQAGGGQVSLGFMGVAGKSYRVEYRQEVGAGLWTTLQTMESIQESGWVEVQDPATEVGRFYRLVVY